MNTDLLYGTLELVKVDGSLVHHVKVLELLHEELVFGHVGRVLLSDLLIDLFLKFFECLLDPLILHISNFKN